MLKYFYFLSITLLIASCAPSNFVKPLEYKQKAVTASLGGALAQVPGIGTLPMPNTTLGFAYGVRKSTTIYTQIYTTSAIFGVAHLNLGCTHRAWESKNTKMGVSFSPNAQLMLDVFEKNFSLYPQLDGNWYWTYRCKDRGEKSNSNFLYVGCSNWLEMRGNKAHLIDQEKRWLFMPEIGHTFERKHLNIQTEFKWIGPNRSNQGIVVDYVSPTTKGALAFYVGLTYKF
jgi:hypothetical protein